MADGNVELKAVATVRHSSSGNLKAVATIRHSSSDDLVISSTQAGTNWIGWQNLEPGVLTLSNPTPGLGFTGTVLQLEAVSGPSNARAWANGGEGGPWQTERIAQPKEFIVGHRYKIQFKYRATEAFKIQDKDSLIQLVPANEENAVEITYYYSKLLPWASSRVILFVGDADWITVQIDDFHIYDITEELKGIAEIRHSDSEEFKGVAELRHSGSQDLKGVADVRHSGSEDLKGKAVIRHYGPPVPITGPSLWLRLDEGAGIAAGDSSGQENNGQLVNAPAWVDGVFGKALDFDGTNERVDLSTAFDALTSLTLTFWFKYSTHPADAVIFSNYKDNVNRFNPFVRNADKRLSSEIVLAGVPAFVISDDPVVAGNWYHAAFVLGAGGMKLYVNGVLQADTDPSTTCLSDIAPAASVQVGELNGGVPFKGTLDDIRIYNRELSPGEILALYRNTDLKGIATINLVSDLKGVAVIRHSDAEEFLGKAIIRHSGSADLKGKAVIRHSADVELKGKAVIRHSASRDLKGRARVANDNFLEQGITYEEFILLTKTITVHAV